MQGCKQGGPMATPPEGKRFVKGQSGNPAGFSAKGVQKKMLKQLGKAEMEKVGKLILQGNIKKLEAIVKEAGKDGKKNKSVLMTLFASVAIKAIAKGDPGALNMLLDRLIGKVPSPVQLTSPDGTMRPQVVLRMPDNGRRAKKPDEPGAD